jgi:hypothetical protein
MKSSEAVQLLTLIADSLDRNPDQISLQCIIAGTSVIHSGSGGTGLSVSAAGGAPGSQTIGFVSQVNAGAPINAVLRNAAKQEVLIQIHEGAATLRELADAVDASPQKRGRILSKLRNNAAIPTFIVELAQLILASVK